LRITIFRFFAAMRPDVSPAGGAHFISARAFLLLLPLVTLCAEAAAVRPFSVSENQVLTAYIAYYGRPADGAGLAYWADRLERAGGDLGAIMQAFGSSQEFTDRFSGLSSQDLVSSLYRQLLARDPDPAGLAYYVAQLDSGAVTLQTIALGVIYGVQNDDVAVVQNRLDVSRYFVAQLEALGPVPEEIPADRSAGVLSTVTADPASRDAAYG
jgi:hypothetical protein